MQTSEYNGPVILAVSLCLQLNLSACSDAGSVSSPPALANAVDEQSLSSETIAESIEPVIEPAEFATLTPPTTDQLTDLAPDPTLTDQPESVSALVPQRTTLSRTVVVGQHHGDVVKILTRLPVSTAQTNIQQSPLDTEHGYVYIANIEPGPDGDTDGVNLHTVLRQGTQDDNGNWQWTKAVVEDRTIHDKWHTAPSVAVDRDGYIHIVYNMHNLPWQYKVSSDPHEIDNLFFQGQSVTQMEIERVKYENKTTFPTLGQARIPGNQITYPAFYKDNQRDLYLTYRFAAKPARAFADRTMSSAIARYDRSTTAWNALGAPVDISVGDYVEHDDAPSLPIAYSSAQGWTSYHPRLLFGPNNGMHVSWFWREGVAGAELSKPCHFYAADHQSFFDLQGNYNALPAKPSDCGNLGFPDDQEFYSIGNSAIDSAGTPHLLLSPIGEDRQIVSFDTDTQRWIHEAAPDGATEIFFDADDTLWAVSTGLVIHKRTREAQSWETVYSDSSEDNCFPRATLTSERSIAYIHAQSCDLESVTIYALNLR